MGLYRGTSLFSEAGALNAEFLSLNSTVTANSANWQSTYTTVYSNSSTWTNVIKETVSATGHPFNTYDTLKMTNTGFWYAKADGDDNADVIGVVLETDGGEFTVVYEGLLSGGPHGFPIGADLFLSPTIKGQLTTTNPSTPGQVSVPVATVRTPDTLLIRPLRGIIVPELGDVGDFNARYVNVSGDSMTGPLFVTGNLGSPSWFSSYTTVNANSAVWGAGIDIGLLDSRYVNTSGDSMTGDLTMGGNSITDVNTLCATVIYAVSAITQVQNIVVQELSGFAVKGGSIDLVNADVNFIVGNLNIQPLSGSAGEALTVNANGTVISSGINISSLNASVVANTQDITNLSIASGGWNNIQSTVIANSAQWATQTDVTGLCAQVSTNTSNIATNTSNIAANTQDITFLSLASGDWNVAYSYVQDNSARLVQQFLDNRFVNVSGDTMTGDLTVNTNISAGDTISVSGIVDHGARDSNPSGTHSDGDTYYNTTQKIQMVYDELLGEWLSLEKTTISFGRNKDVGTGEYFRGPGTQAYSDTDGWVAPLSGIVTELSISKQDSNGIFIEVTEDGNTISSYNVGTGGSASSRALSGRFAPNDIIGIRNSSSSGGDCDNAIGFINIRYIT